MQPLTFLTFLTFSQIIYLFSSQLIVIGFYLLAILIIAKNYRNELQIKHKDLYPIYLLTIWMFLSCFWSINATKSLDTGVRITLMNVLGIVTYYLMPKTKFVINVNYKKLFTIILTLINLLILLEHYHYYKISLYLRWLLGFSLKITQPFDKGSVLLLMLMPSFLYSLYHRSFLYYLLICITCITFSMHLLFAANLAFTLMVLTSLAFMLFKRRLVGLIFMGSASMCMLTPLIFSIFNNERFLQFLLPKIELSWKYRVEIWQNTLVKIMEKPMLGHGMGSSPYLTADNGTQLLQLHPHNGFLQIWVELGAIGAIFVSLILINLYNVISKIKDNKLVLLSLMTFVGYFTFFSVSYGIWQYWFIGSIWVALISLKKLTFTEET